MCNAMPYDSVELHLSLYVLWNFDRRHRHGFHVSNDGRFGRTRECCCSLWDTGCSTVAVRRYEAFGCNNEDMRHVEWMFQRVPAAGVEVTRHSSKRKREESDAWRQRTCVHKISQLYPNALQLLCVCSFDLPLYVCRPSSGLN